MVKCLDRGWFADHSIILQAGVARRGRPVCDPDWSATTKPTTNDDLLHQSRLQAEPVHGGTTAGGLIPSILRRGFQEPLEAEVTIAIGAQHHERPPGERAAQRLSLIHI